ncbi:MAG: bifunctional riboflavin kinase/FAD synthetase [Eubacterium sp.]|nr:bifunctional riboflavin kinase/FAD synthetase [Eubacterium sp.]
MKVINDLEFQLHQTAVCIGKFDGIHKGHRLLIEKTKETGLPVVMFTFQMLQPRGIYSLDEKEKLAESLGVDYLVSVTVTEEFMHMSAMQFVEEILCDKCDAKEIFVGEDFCFGYQRSGTAAMLKSLESVCGFHVNVFEKIKVDDIEVSSTRIRRELEIGNLEAANQLLDMPYFIKGTVVSGNQIGRTISVPTANVIPAEGKILPPKGVYAVMLDFRGKILQGVANLGTKPTVSGDNLIGLEISIFDFNETIYEEEVIVYLMAYQRSEKKFASLDDLKKQIQCDTKKAKEILSSLNIQYRLL